MTSPEDPPRSPLWRRLLGNSGVWSVVCAAVALPFFLVGQGLDFGPFLLALGAGWLAGIWVVNATLRMRPAWRGLLVHGVVALVGASLAAWSVVGGAAADAGRSAVVQGAVLFLQLCAVTGVCWIWLGLLVRALAALPNRHSTSGR
ncbi:hypothetical protein [Microbacterium sp. cx-59]|uniref:hypothetical protein n=1 Tax=Microbacterium sp. cx-59 TaxID=2891207 RepID=UPI001E6232DA|nr:hypothetical protein [Microbacterium sp. cx-59]MCC4907656.1 hypothetical protein [Microbacterium sp. cx-59]